MNSKKKREKIVVTMYDENLQTIHSALSKIIKLDDETKDKIDLKGYEDKQIRGLYDLLSERYGENNFDMQDDRA